MPEHRVHLNSSDIAIAVGIMIVLFVMWLVLAW